MKGLGLFVCVFFVAGLATTFGCFNGRLREGSNPSSADTGAAGYADSISATDTYTAKDTDQDSDANIEIGPDTGIHTDAYAGTDSNANTDSSANRDTQASPDTDKHCELPSSFQWSSSGPLINPTKSIPDHNFLSVKDPTIVFYKGKYHVFATSYDTTWRSVYLNFTDFSKADSAPQMYMGNWATGNTVAPQVFYFRPHKKWYLIFQWGARYSTNNDINNTNGWSKPQKLLAGEPNNALDFWVICDDVNCYLFFSADDGKLYLSKTAIGNFPSFSGYNIIMSEPKAGDLFEASNVYKIKGQNKYLLLVECYGPRYFRSWTSNSLDGPWVPLADTQQNPFAGKANVIKGNKWSNDISHGEMIRAGYDEKMEIDSCNMQFLYQGVEPSSAGGPYGRIPWKLGLLTKTN